jgi:acyl phosphate:glycerol-3-phosphate acyltransferase
LFPLYFHFRGGKGVATAAGIMLAIDWRIALTLLVIWVLVAAISRYSSLAAIVAAILSPLAAFHFLGWVPLTWAVLMIAVLLLWRHRGNIERLLAGNESRIRLKRS